MTTDNHDATTCEPNSLYGTVKSRMVAERMVCKSPILILKSCLSHDVNESVAYFEGHPELKFDGCNSKRAVVSAFKNPDAWLKSLCVKARKQELCDGVTDVEEIAILMPQILTQMLEATVETPATDREKPSSCAPRDGAGHRVQRRP